jgi:hypothetical protein
MNNVTLLLAKFESTSVLVLVVTESSDKEVVFVQFKMAAEL